MTKRLSLSLRDRDARLVRKLARHHRVSAADILRLAVWAYVMPLAPTLKAPVELPEPVELPMPDFPRPRRQKLTKSPVRP
jgi:hypothetical protein